MLSFVARLPRPTQLAFRKSAQCALVGLLLDALTRVLNRVGVRVLALRRRCFSVRKLNELLVLALHGRATVSCQLPFAALEFSEPEPDFAILPLGDYDSDHPSEAYLIIEVSESSLAMDRGKKLRLYASCAVPEYWVVNLPERCIEVYTGPIAGAYSHVERYERGQSIRLVAFPDVSLAVSDVLK